MQLGWERCRAWLGSAVAGRYAVTVIAQGAIFGLGVASGILTARLLGPSGRGILAAITIWPLAIAFLSSLGMNQAIIFQLGKLRHSYAHLSGSVLVIGVAQSAFVIVAGLFLLPIALRQYPPEALKLAYWFLAFTPVAMLGGYPASLLLALRHGRAFNLLRAVAPGAFVFGLVLLTAFSATNSVAKVVVVQLASYGTALVVGLVLLKKKKGVWPETSRKATGDLLRYGLRAQATNLTTYFNQRCDQLVLSLLVAPRELGLYAVGVTLAMAIAFVPQAVGLVTFAEGASEGTETVGRTVGASFRLSLAWLAVTSIALFMVAPLLIGTVLGNEFLGAATACRILLPGMIAAGLNQVLYNGANAMGYPELPSVAELAGVLVTIAGLICIVPRYGFLGAAAVSTTAYVLSFVVMMYLSANRLGLNIVSMVVQRRPPTGSRVVQPV